MPSIKQVYATIRDKPTLAFKNMRTYYLYWIVLILVQSCHSPKPKVDSYEQDYLIFGHFYGRCMGESCVETYKLTDKQLFKDTIDDYNGETFDFVVLGNRQFEKVKDLASSIPGQLEQEKETVIGCPDCTDGGGLFIELAKDGKVQRWRIDQHKGNVPSYLHPFMDAVNVKIKLLDGEK